MISRDEGFKLLEWLEGYQLHQRRKLAVIRTLLTAPDEIDKANLTLEVAFTAKLRQHLPNLPDEVMERVVPYLGMLDAEGMGNKLPWNRHKRQGKTYHPPLLAQIKRTGIDNVVALALRAPVLRNDECPYGVPSLSAADKELVLGDSVLVFRFWSMFIMAEDVRDLSLPPTQFYMEQPEDPARYRNQQDVQQHGYFSLFPTQERQDFAERYNLHQFHFDQHPMGRSKRKPTTLATNVSEMWQLDGLRGAPPNEAELNNQFGALPCSGSKM
eukprot:s3762_g6.t1